MTNAMLNKPPKGHRKTVSRNLMRLLDEIPGGRFLEIGIGPKFRLKRLQKLVDKNISYTGMDFEPVCKMHKDQVVENNLPDDNITYIDNRVGTYLYNLIRLKRSRRKFDLIYLDGHHTMYVDFPAAMAVVPLLADSGYFVLDDVTWTLARKEESLAKSEFYQDIYDFNLYTEEEKREAHIKIIIDEYLIPEFGFEIVDKLSVPSWIVLRRKGKSWRSMWLKLTYQWVRLRRRLARRKR